MLITLQGVTKRFGSRAAIEKASFTIAAGSFHGIVGENGAGKSTTMKCLYGLHVPDEGVISLRAKPIAFQSPKDAIRERIGMVQQHFQLIPRLSVWENIILGEERALFWLPAKRIQEKLVALQNEYGFSLDLKSPVENLSLGEQQQVEILKCLYRDADILILDEPTAVLTPHEVDTLFLRLKKLQAAGKTLIVVTHKLREILSYTDQVTVMRAGKVLTTVPTASLTQESLAEWIMGKLPGRLEKTATKTTGETRLTFQNVSTETSLPRLRLHDLSFSVRAGEVMGVAGIEGNGQEAIVETLMGLLPHEGTIQLLGESLSKRSVYQWKQEGVGCIPPDRQQDGLILNFSLTENFLLGRQREKEWGYPFLSLDNLSVRFQPLWSENGVVPADPELPVRALSGGNQQKLLFARETDQSCRLLIICHPTRGVDIGAARVIHERILALRANNAAILLISSEIEELCALSDQLLVLHGGRKVAELSAKDAREKELGIWMTGGRVT